MDEPQKATVTVQPFKDKSQLATAVKTSHCSPERNPTELWSDPPAERMVRVLSGWDLIKYIYLMVLVLVILFNLTSFPTMRSFAGPSLSEVDQSDKNEAYQRGRGAPLQVV